MPPDMPGSFDPYSSNAQFATILERLSRQDVNFSEHRDEMKILFSDFKSDLVEAKSRVTTLEQEKWSNRGFVAAIGLAIPFLWQWITSPHSPKS